MHMIMWVMSDRAIPRSFRFMEGFGVHTFRLVNAKDKSTFVKFHWKPKLGLQSVLWNEAVKINGADPDFHRRDSGGDSDPAIFRNGSCSFSYSTRHFADSFDFDVLDPTKTHPGRDLAADCRSAVWCSTGCLTILCRDRAGRVHDAERPPGIDFSNDPLLQGRNFSYLDTQLKRLGSPNFTHIPINAPKCPFHHSSRTATWRCAIPTGRVNYQPNSFGRRPARIARSMASRHFPDVEQGAKAPAARREFCRSLQPGAPVLHQPDRRSSRTISRPH